MSVISDLFPVNFHRNSQSFEQNVDNLKGLPQAAPVQKVQRVQRVQRVVDCHWRGNE